MEQGVINSINPKISTQILQKCQHKLYAYQEALLSVVVKNDFRVK